jgi:hypothetical protein
MKHLFHALGKSLHEPFEYLPKITSKTDPKAVYMWVVSLISVMNWGC